MKTKKLRGATAMKAAGYKFKGAWFDQKAMEQIDNACRQAGYTIASFLRDGAHKLALTILTPAQPPVSTVVERHKPKEKPRGKAKRKGDRPHRSHR